MLTDREILNGFRKGESQIVVDYFYGPLRVVYRAMDSHYQLGHKEGMDFYSLAHEYYMHLMLKDWCQLKDRKKGATLRSWLMGGFRFLVLDKMKEFVRYKERMTVLEGAENRQLRFDMLDDTTAADVRHTVIELCNRRFGRDHQSSVLLKMMLVDGFMGKEVAKELGMTPAAISQRYHRLMNDVVIPYFKNYYDHEEPSVKYCEDMLIDEEKGRRCCSKVYKPHGKARRSMSSFFADDASFFADDAPRGKRVTPPRIERLAANEVFVFGSNLAGMHGGDASRIAHLRFGAKMGRGTGLQGQSYAIPTMQGGTDTIAPYVNRFIDFAREHSELTFLVTPIGCGLAGFTPDEIAPLFRRATSVNNIYLPSEFWNEL